MVVNDSKAAEDARANRGGFCLKERHWGKKLVETQKRGGKPELNLCWGGKKNKQSHLRGEGRGKKQTTSPWECHIRDSKPGTVSEPKETNANNHTKGVWGKERARGGGTIWEKDRMGEAKPLSPAENQSGDRKDEHNHTPKRTPAGSGGEKRIRENMDKKARFQKYWGAHKKQNRYSS